MFDIISYCLVYALLGVLVLGAPLYILCFFLDHAIGDLTNGKHRWILINKVVDPLLFRIGFIRKNCLDCYEVTVLGFIFTALSLLSFLLFCISFTLSGVSGLLPYEMIALVTDKITPYVSAPLMIVLVYLLLRGVIKKGFYKYEQMQTILNSVDTKKNKEV